MKLPAAVIHEIAAIEKRINYLSAEDCLLVPEKWRQMKYLHQHELQTYRMRIETLYSDLDCQENSISCETCEAEKVALLHVSISIETILRAIDLFISGPSPLSVFDHPLRTFCTVQFDI